MCELSFSRRLLLAFKRKIRQKQGGGRQSFFFVFDMYFTEGSNGSSSGVRTSISKEV